MQALNIELSGWQPRPVTPPSVQYLFSSSINLTEYCNTLIARQAGFGEISHVLISSYRSYLMQAVKDIDVFLSGLKQPVDVDRLSHEAISASIDTMFVHAQPWRFTAQAIAFVAKQVDIKELDGLSEPEQIKSFILPVMALAFDRGALYRFDKYFKVGHVLFDMLFDAGWDCAYLRVSDLKSTDGFSGNPQRGASLREIALYLARNLYTRGEYQAARHFLFLGFPDIPDVVASLSEEELKTLVLHTPPQKTAQTLLSSDHKLSMRNVNCNHIVQGAMRILNRE